MVGGIQQVQRFGSELSIHRIRWRHRPDQGRNGGFRRLGRAALCRRSQDRRPRPVPDRDRRHRSRGQPAGHPGRAGAPHGGGAGRHLPRQDQEVGRPGARPDQPWHEAPEHGHHGRPSVGRIGHDVQLRGLPLEGKPRVEEQGRPRHLDFLARRGRRQGQRRCCRLRRAHQRFDRLRRVRLRAAEQDDLHAPAERGRHLHEAEHRCVPGCRGERRLGARAGFRSRDDQRAGPGRLPDRGDDLHPHAPAAQERPVQPSGARLLQVGARTWTADGGEPRLRAAAAGAGLADRGLLVADIKAQ